MPTPVLTVEAGLSGRYRVRAVNERFAVGYWPLGQVASDIAWNILDHPSAQYMHAVYNGTGFTRAVSLPFPEGMLGLGFNGGWLQVPSDHLVSSGEYNLSAAGGALLLAFPIVTTANNATLRCIIQKQDTNATGNGYHAALQNGAIEFFVKVGGSTIFSFQRGAIADGLLHTVVCYYAPGTTNEARVYIDGVLSGAAVTGVSTEPLTTTANLRIGAFNDDSGTFAGDTVLGDVMMSRDANADIAAQLDASQDWTVLTPDVRVPAGLTIRRGMTGTSMLDRVSGAGTLTLGLDNSAANSAGLVGYYSPGHANARTGFALGVPIKVTFTYSALEVVQFRGWVKRIIPTAGTFGERVTDLVAVDWMDQAARVNVGGLEAQINEQSEIIFGLVLDRAGRPPSSVDIATGGEEFRFALDSAPTDEVTPIQEFARIEYSEFGYAYIRGDGTLVHETRDTRQLIGDNVATFDNSMDGLEVAYDAAELVNRVRAIIYPREVGAVDSTVLSTLTGEHAIGPGQTITLESLYRDPEQRAARVGAVDIQDPDDPSPGTDYALNTAANGGGTDLTALLTVDVVDGATAREWTLTNTSAQVGYLVDAGGNTLLQVRGRIIRTFEPVPVIRADQASVREHDDHVLSYEMPYQSSLDDGLSIGNYIINLYKDAQAFVRSISFIANKNATLLTHALTREIGDRIGIVETVTGVNETIAGSDAPRGYFIQSVSLESVGSDATGPILRCTWGLVPGPPTGAVWQLGIVGASELGETTWMAL